MSTRDLADSVNSVAAALTDAIDTLAEALSPLEADTAVERTSTIGEYQPHEILHRYMGGTPHSGQPSARRAIAPSLGTESAPTFEATTPASALPPSTHRYPRSPLSRSPLLLTYVDDVNTVAANVKKLATACAITLANRPPGPDHPPSVAAVGDLIRATLLVVVTCLGLGSFPGSELRRTAHDACRVLIQAVTTLLQGFLAMGGDAISPEQVPVRSGQVWAACDALARLPGNNRTALTRAYVRVLKSMFVTMEELEEEVAKNLRHLHGKGKEKSRNNDDDEDDNDKEGKNSDEEDACVVVDFETQTASTVELMVQQKSLALSKVVVESMRPLMKVVLSSTLLVHGDRTLHGEIGLSNFTGAAVELEGLVAANYAPITSREVAQHAETLRRKLVVCIMELKFLGHDVGEEGVSGALADLREALSLLDAENGACE